MKIIGHRGAKALAPENTLSSFNKALEHRVDEIELDLRVSSDNVVVINHDPVVHDQAGNKLKVRTNTLAELRKHKTDLLTLEEFVKEFGAPIPLIIEVKPKQPLTPITRALQRAFRHPRWTPETITFASFDMHILFHLHQVFPDVTVVINESWSSLRARWFANRLGTKRISMNQMWLWSGFLKAAHRRGYQVSAYTINNPTRARKWAPYLYGVVTDHPDLLKK